MRDIDFEDRGGLLAPLKNIRFFARKPVTVPLEPRPAFFPLILLTSLCLLCPRRPRPRLVVR